MVNLKKASDFRLGVGCYKWWATKDDVLYILDKLELKERKPLTFLEHINHDGIDLYCIYVGSASKESLMSRLNWHINGKNGKSHISTLRRTIAAVYGYNLYDDDAISKKLSEFYISWEEIDVNGLTNKKLIENKVVAEEKNLISKEHYRPLNIKDNEHPIAKKTIPELERLRAQTRTHVMNNDNT